jgi:hypothetical protein
VSQYLISVSLLLKKFLPLVFHLFLDILVNSPASCSKSTWLRPETFLRRPVPVDVGLSKIIIAELRSARCCSSELAGIKD